MNNFHLIGKLSFALPLHSIINPLPIKYTPDFVGEDFIIETKGRANESFPMRWKLFKKFINKCYPRVTLYKPQNQKECDQVIELLTIKNKLYGLGI